MIKKKKTFLWIELNNLIIKYTNATYNLNQFLSNFTILFRPTIKFVKKFQQLKNKLIFKEHNTIFLLDIYAICWN